MKTIYNVYVDCGKIVHDGELVTYKNDFKKFYDKNEALNYKTTLEKSFTNVIMEEIKFKQKLYNDF